MSNGAVKSAKNGNGGQVPDSPRYESVSLAPPPDGGWGWMVVFASFMIHIVSEYFLFTYKTTSVAQQFLDEISGSIPDRNNLRNSPF